MLAEAKEGAVLEWLSSWVEPDDVDDDEDVVLELVSM